MRLLFLQTLQDLGRKVLLGTSKNTISPCVEAPITYNLDS